MLKNLTLPRLETIFVNCKTNFRFIIPIFIKLLNIIHRTKKCWRLNSVERKADFRKTNIRYQAPTRSLYNFIIISTLWSNNPLLGTYIITTVLY